MRQIGFSNFGVRHLFTELLPPGGILAPIWATLGRRLGFAYLASQRSEDYAVGR